jgi:hypothetical protein
MSMKVLRALVGDEAFARLSEDEIRTLCDAIDAEILKDDWLSSKLLIAVQTTAEQLRSAQS